MVTPLRVANLSRTPLRIGKTKIPRDGSLATVDLDDPEVRRCLLQFKGLWVAYPPYWHSGTGVPSDAVGSDGDFYLDTATTNIYMKEGGSWA
jgi:hypothetical protein